MTNKQFERCMLVLTCDCNDTSERSFTHISGFTMQVSD